MTTILIKKRDTTGAPAPGDLTNAAGGTEIAVNTADLKVYTKNSGGSIVQIGSGPSATDTLTNKTISGANNTLSNIANSSLTNSSINFTYSGGVTGSASTALGGTNALSLSNVPNASLQNSSITFGGTSIALGASSNTLANDITIHGLTIGRGAGNQATNTAVGASALAANTSGITNTAVGQLSLVSNTSGSVNSSFGRAALALNTTGSDNTAIGHTALYSNTTGNANTAQGVDALYSNTTASNNTAVGYQAAFSNTTGARNTAIGYSALLSNTTAADNTAVGFESLRQNTTGNSLAALGYAALYSNTTGTANVAIGLQALVSNTTASNNTAVGYQAGYSTTTGFGNVTIGSLAGYSGTTAQYQTVVGFGALQTSTGSNNTAVGVFSLNAATTATSNTAVGPGAGSVITTGSKNTILGAYNGNQSGLDIRTTSNFIVLSDGDGNVALSTQSNNTTIALAGSTPQFGTGITFPATQNASSNANTLDDYEEGTWTPTLSGYTGTTFNQRLGRYVKIGRLVYLSFYIEITSIGTFSSNARITGAPFAASNETTTFGQGSQPTVATALNATRDDQYLAFFSSSSDIFMYSKTGGAFSGNSWIAGEVAGTLTYLTAN
jgi:hypothetical protein